jgi:hypothetical protein
MQEQATRACPECKMQIPAGAHKCAHCRTRLATPQNLFWGILVFAVILYHGHKMIKALDEADAALDSVIKQAQQIKP